MNSAELKIVRLIEEHRGEIISFANDIYNHGELGYKEFRTSEKFQAFMENLGLRVENNLAITGVKSYLNEDKKSSVSLALLGELDALRIPEHAHANPETKAAHCCGHHAQLAGVIGAAFALTDPEIVAQLDGQVVFFAVPAEEYGEIEFKNRLKKEGKIVYGGGKSELIRVGAFDDIDLSLAHHTRPDADVVVGTQGDNGFVSKVIRYHGRPAHAAGCPEMGVNALSAASIGLSALAYQRETFRDEDIVRVHPILTRGGDLVNVVPGEAVIETLVRAASTEAIENAAQKTDRAFKAGAYAMGTGYEIETMPGYLPTIEQEGDANVLAAAKDAVQEKYKVGKMDISKRSGGSTDLGDLAHIQPVLSFETGGTHGGLHTADFTVTDEELAYIITAKIFALSAYRLLCNGAAAAKQVRDSYVPRFTKEEYLRYMDSQMKTESQEIPFVL